MAYVMKNLPTIPRIVTTKALFSKGIQIIIIKQNKAKLDVADHLRPIISNPQIVSKSAGSSRKLNKYTP